MSEHGTWWEPTLAGIQKAYDDGEFDYRTAPSVGLLLAEIARLRDELGSVQPREKEQ